MDNVLVIGGIILLIWFLGFDMSSYLIMKKIDPLYKKHNKYLIGYNTYRVWKSYRTYRKQNGNSI